MSTYTTGAYYRLTSDGTHAYQYDHEGNVTRKTAISGGAYTTYEWDHRNRLTMVKDYTSAHVQTRFVYYGYDAYNQLVLGAGRTGCRPLL